MEIKATRKIEDSIMSTTLTIENFGSADMSAEEEMEVLADYKLELNTGKIIFAKYVKIDDHGSPVIVEVEQATPEEPATDNGDDSGNDTEPAEPTEPTEPTAPDNDLIVLAMPIETYRIDKNMAIKYAVDIDKLNVDFSQFNVITDRICLGKAMLLTFENVVIAWIKENLAISKQHHNDFESEVTYII